MNLRRIRNIILIKAYKLDMELKDLRDDRINPHSKDFDTEKFQEEYQNKFNQFADELIQTIEDYC
jgi:hypothetical protein